MLLDDSLVIRVQNATKVYKLYDKPSDRLKEVILPWKKVQHKEFYATKNISFNVKKGETVGIIGKNGSGKSTLLKMVTGILTPTTGTIHVVGRISSLLELGAGFNPELTGIENVFLNGAIMGFSKEELDCKIEEILDFADIGDFIYQPVKNYSSGMYVRLAFATAITVEPDILIVDEALAVGDVSFQNKCYRKFEQLKKNGVTILFVTHAIELITRHCDRAVLINEGHLLADGKPNVIVNMYMDIITSQNVVLDVNQEVENEYNESAASLKNIPSDYPLGSFINKTNYNQAEYRWGDGRAKIIDYLLIADGQPDPNLIRTNSNVDLYVKYRFYDTVDNFMCGVTLKTIDGIIVFAYNTRAENIEFKPQQVGKNLVVKFSFKLTTVTGKYTISLGCSENKEYTGNDHIPLDRRNDLIIIEVLNENEISGIIDPSMFFQECNMLPGDENDDSSKSLVNYFVTQ